MDMAAQLSRDTRKTNKAKQSALTTLSQELRYAVTKFQTYG